MGRESKREPRVVFGFHAILARLRSDPSSVVELFVDEGRNDARIRDLSSQVDHLEGRIYTLERRQQRQDAYLYAHAVWDQKMLEAAIKACEEIDLAPFAGWDEPWLVRDRGRHCRAGDL